MSNFEQDYQFMMNNEDRTQAHAMVPDSCPDGCAGPCFAISGINSGAFPTQFRQIAATPQPDRGALVEKFYYENFWDQWFAGITSDDVCERIFDCAVNSGMPTAVKIAQTAVNTLGQTVAVDGVWGPATLNAINACDPAALVAAYRAAHVAHLQANDASNPYLAQLIARAEE